MDDSGYITQESQENVDEQVRVAPLLEEYTKRWENDGNCGGGEDRSVKNRGESRGRGREGKGKGSIRIILKMSEQVNAIVEVEGEGVVVVVVV